MNEHTLRNSIDEPFCNNLCIYLTMVLRRDSYSFLATNAYMSISLTITHTFRYEDTAI